MQRLRHPSVQRHDEKRHDIKIKLDMLFRHRIARAPLQQRIVNAETNGS